jgi:hypothetical protein
MQTKEIFFHPDCTVGSGIAPDLPCSSRTKFTTITAGKEFHLALKTESNISHCFYQINTLFKDDEYV